MGWKADSGLRSCGVQGPVGGVDIREDAVAFFDGGEAGGLVVVEGAVVLPGLPDGFDLGPLLVVGEEAELGVIAGGAGGDEELPVGGFEEEELAAELLHDLGSKGGFSPAAGGSDLASVKLGGVYVGVSPGGFGVEPDLVVALGSPGALVHGNGAGARVPSKVVGTGDEVNAEVGFVEYAGYRFKPEGTLEPPVAEEFRVEWRAKNGNDVGIEAWLGRLFFQGLSDKVDKMLGVGLNASDAASCG